MRIRFTVVDLRRISGGFAYQRQSLRDEAPDPETAALEKTVRQALAAAERTPLGDSTNTFGPLTIRDLGLMFDAVLWVRRRVIDDRVRATRHLDRPKKRATESRTELVDLIEKCRRDELELRELEDRILKAQEELENATAVEFELRPGPTGDCHGE